LIQQGIQPKRVLDQEGGLLFEFGKPVRTKPLQPDEELKPIEVEDLAAMLEPGGAFSNHIEGFEHRSQQVEMLRAVGNALNEGQHRLVEAGTGTGKSLAYSSLGLPGRSQTKSGSSSPPTPLPCRTN
jgi:hypothetical protein